MTEENTTQTAAAESADAHLGDAGKKALASLRSENKELKARLKALEDANSGERDAAAEADSTSESATLPTETSGERDAAESVIAEQPSTPRFQGTADGGARNTPSVARQLTRSDLSGMSAAAIDAARRGGQLRDLMSGD